MLMKSINTEINPRVGDVFYTKTSSAEVHVYTSLLIFFFSFSSPDVVFCGYTIPHPAEDQMLFRIQSRETPALEVLKRGLKDLEKVCDHTINLFEKEVKDFSKM